MSGLVQTLLPDPTYTSDNTSAEEAFIKESSAYAEVMTFQREITCDKMQELSSGAKSLPESVRPLLHLMETVGKLVWFEVVLASVCTILSCLTGFVHIAQALLAIGFLLVVKVKLHAVRTMTSGPPLLHGDVLTGFLEHENYSMFGIELPVPRYIVLTVIYLPNYAEATLTGISLPAAFLAEPDFALALAVLLGFAMVVQVTSSLMELRMARFWLMGHIGDVAGGYSTDQSLNEVWHFLTMSAASSNLMMIAACGDKMQLVTLKSERQLWYRCMMHSPNSVSQRVWSKGIASALPRLLVKVQIFMNMGGQSLSGRSTMLFAIATTLISLAQLMQKSVGRIKEQRSILKQLKAERPDLCPDLSITAAMWNPFSDQMVADNNGTHILGDSSIYGLFFMTVGCIVACIQLQGPIHDMIQDCRTQFLG